MGFRLLPRFRKKGEPIQATIHVESYGTGDHRYEARPVTMAIRGLEVSFQVEDFIAYGRTRRGAGLEDRRKRAVKPANELYIREAGRGKYLSQEHFFIDQNPDGTFSLVDRGSTLGTLVEGLLIGGEENWGTVQLFHGAVIIPGGQDSPYVFRFEIREPGGAFRKTDPEIA